MPAQCAGLGPKTITVLVSKPGLSLRSTVAGAALSQLARASDLATKSALDQARRGRHELAEWATHGQHRARHAGCGCGPGPANAASASGVTGVNSRAPRRA